jgi:hypothetical protein
MCSARTVASSAGEQKKKSSIKQAIDSTIISTCDWAFEPLKPVWIAPIEADQTRFANCSERILPVEEIFEAV